MTPISVTDLAAVVYSAGKVFDGLQTGRLDTEEFLRTGATGRITSMHDLALLHDLKQAAALVAARGTTPLDAGFVRELNASMTRSASIEPGALRGDDERIGVSTPYGRHEPPAVTGRQLERLIVSAATTGDPRRGAAGLFLAVAKAQPFKDGNKRTAIFAANALLLRTNPSSLLTVPFDEDDPAVAQDFNNKLARAYIFDEDAAVLEMLLNLGFVAMPDRARLPRSDEQAKLRELKQKIAQRAAALENRSSPPGAGD